MEEREKENESRSMPSIFNIPMDLKDKYRLALAQKSIIAGRVISMSSDLRAYMTRTVEKYGTEDVGVNETG